VCPQVQRAPADFDFASGEQGNLLSSEMQHVKCARRLWGGPPCEPAGDYRCLRCDSELDTEPHQIGLSWTQCVMCGAKYCGHECMVLHKHMEVLCPFGAAAPPPVSLEATQAVVAAQGAGPAAASASGASGQPQPPQPPQPQEWPMTGGAVQRMYHDDNTPGSVVQVLDIRRLSTDNPVAVERFRLVVSDGQHYQQAVVVTELNARIKSGEIQTLGLIKLTEIFCKVVMGRRVIIIFGLEVMSCPVEKLGKPSNVDPNVGTIQQPPSAQQPQCLHERQLQEQTGQLMDDWCCREFCNKAGCVSAGGSCWFEWGVELVLRFLRGCAVAEPDTRASYLVERCGVDPAIVAECLLVAQRRHGSPVFCHNALMDLIRRPGNGANVGRAQSVCDAAEGHVSLAQARLHDARIALAGAQDVLRRQEQRLEQLRARGEATPWAADVHLLEGIARAAADQEGAPAAGHCPEMESLESEGEVGCLYGVFQRASYESSIMSFEAHQARAEQEDWEEDMQMAGFYAQCDDEAAYDSCGSW
jgi:hypothetical protein